MRDKPKLNCLNFFYINHLRALCFAIGDLIKAPFSSIMTIVVIAITIALPAILLLFLQNFNHLNTHFNHGASLTVYTQSNLPSSTVAVIVKKVSDISMVAHTHYISPSTGLQSFRKFAHLGSALNNIQNNPLPGAIIVTPKNSSTTMLSQLKAQLTTLPHVISVSLDLTWIKRLMDITTIAKRITYVLGILFCFGVIIITGNTIRLTTENSQQEIRILRLIGATSSFIRRPLLYRGLLYGFFGGLLAWFLVYLCLLWLSAPVGRLVSSYNSQFLLQGLSFNTALSIIMISTLLSLAGAYLAVNEHLKSDEHISI